MIYGIDVNPFSIELAKLSLWIDSFIFGTPLSFIEHHIKCGNALMGSSFEDLNLDPNSLFAKPFKDRLDQLKTQFKALSDLKDTKPEEIAQSKDLYVQAQTAMQELNLMLHTRTALDFLDNTKTHKDKPSLREKCAALFEGGLEEGLEELNNPKDPYKLKEAVIKLAQQHRFFNYEIAFPELVDDQARFSGFDAIIGNPPWEKSKFDESEFFASLRSNYRSFSLQEKADFKKEALSKAYIQQEYDTQKAHIQTTNAYYKAHYPLSRGAGDGNLFRFFIERNLSLLCAQAKLALVIPSALMLEEGSLNLRSAILEQHHLEFFYSFENRQGIFPDVHRCYKFALLGVRSGKATLDKATPSKATLAKVTPAKATPAKATLLPIKALFYLEDPKDIAQLKPLLISPKDLLNTPKRALKEVRSPLDLQILEHCSKRFAKLSEAWLDFRSELHMTADKDLFKPIDTRKTPAKSTLEEATLEAKATLLPLLEGKHIHQFNAQFSPPRFCVELEALQEKLKSREEHRAKKGGYTGAIAYEFGYFRLGYRKIARDTDERSLVASLLPKNCAVGESMYFVVPKLYAPKGIIEMPLLQTLFTLGLFNSLVVDYYLRSLTQINITRTYLGQLPLPQPSPTEIENNPLYVAIAKSALECQLYHDTGHFSALKTLFKDLDVPKTAKLFDTKRAKLDILIARDIYALNRAEFLHLLESFKVLAKKQPEFVALLKELWEAN
ncbi:Eco57I restriction-modification methylase domain-containing protein [Helicobacter labacensis]|uniref:Eco57I restriction-modification methylase domain-containing protein n=1 Tax=Helicobacter labacensis TaxID=2316079 RepID=UPI001F401B77|nr:Eco57I restriction-modification methylase domain-containing protein [Helicobacter labacensis]